MIDHDVATKGEIKNQNEISTLIAGLSDLKTKLNILGYVDNLEACVSILRKEKKQLLSELEATQSLQDKIAKLDPTYGVSDGYSDGYYAAISAVEKILKELANGTSEKH